MVTRYRTPNQLYMRNYRIYLVLALLMMGTLDTEVKGQCDFTVELTKNCMDNGTPCDPTDDFYQIFALVLNGANPGLFHVDFGGVSVGPFPYAPIPTFLGNFNVGLNGSVICGDFWDEADPSCGEFKYCTERLFPCSDTFVWFDVFGSTA